MQELTPFERNHMLVGACLAAILRMRDAGSAWTPKDRVAVREAMGWLEDGKDRLRPEVQHASAMDQLIELMQELMREVE